MQESYTPGSTGGVSREGHVYQQKPHVRILRGISSVRGLSTRQLISKAISNKIPEEARKPLFELMVIAVALIGLSIFKVLLQTKYIKRLDGVEKSREA